MHKAPLGACGSRSRSRSGSLAETGHHGRERTFDPKVTGSIPVRPIREGVVGGGFGDQRDGHRGLMTDEDDGTVAIPNDTCTMCGGSGDAKDGTACPLCKGTGTIDVSLPDGS